MGVMEDYLAADPWQGLQEDLEQQWLIQERLDWVADYEQEEENAIREHNGFSRRTV